MSVIGDQCGVFRERLEVGLYGESVVLPDGDTSGQSFAESLDGSANQDFLLQSLMKDGLSAFGSSSLVFRC